MRHVLTPRKQVKKLFLLFKIIYQSNDLALIRKTRKWLQLSGKIYNLAKCF